MKGETRQRLLDSINNLNVWKRGDERAPHKPLLLLLALSRIARGEPRLVAFRDIEEPLTRLLRDFGPPRKSLHPEYPFWRLQNDKLWELENVGDLTRRKGNNDPLKSELINNNVTGGFPVEFNDLLKKDPVLLRKIVHLVLEANFPSTLHEEIVNALSLPFPDAVCLRRDSAFRFLVIRAYEHRCAICGYDIKIGASDLALEAAHIKWHQAGGPDEVFNGLALCTLHHKAFDRGAISISQKMTIIISSELHGQSWVREWFELFRGKKLYIPTRVEWMPAAKCIEWHLAEVFRHPAKE
jgi:putative restriction endonuclease